MHLLSTADLDRAIDSMHFADKENHAAHRGIHSPRDIDLSGPADPELIVKFGESCKLRIIDLVRNNRDDHGFFDWIQIQHARFDSWVKDTGASVEGDLSIVHRLSNSETEVKTAIEVLYNLERDLHDLHYMDRYSRIFVLEESDLNKLSQSPLHARDEAILLESRQRFDYLNGHCGHVKLTVADKFSHRLLSVEEGIGRLMQQATRMINEASQTSAGVPGYQETYGIEGTYLSTSVEDHIKNIIQATLGAASGPSGDDLDHVHSKDNQFELPVYLRERLQRIMVDRWHRVIYHQYCVANYTKTLATDHTETLAHSIRSKSNAAGHQIYPRPPKVAPSVKTFACSFCAHPKSIDFLTRQQWRDHVVEDLSPYFCTFEHCRDPYQTYPTIGGWLRHLRYEHHQHGWSCRYCPKIIPAQFEDEGSYEAHRAEQHPEMIGSTERQRILPEFSCCPLCGFVSKAGSGQSKSRDFQKDMIEHMYEQHMKVLALGSIPCKISMADDDSNNA